MPSSISCCVRRLAPCFVRVKTNTCFHFFEEIKNDKRHIKELKNIEYVEKYAREKYYMKKDSEDIYIIEFEGDTVKKK